MQNEDEMRGQQNTFDSRMATAELEASGMRTAYDQLVCDNAEQMEVAVQVSLNHNPCVLRTPCLQVANNDIWITPHNI